jgi:hypothetical protein
MARDNITDKGSTKTSPWFGHKYRVTPESSKLLQEAVFADGGSWLSGVDKIQFLTEKWLQVSDGGKIGLPPYSKDLPEKEPPISFAEKAGFEVGKYYKCTDDHLAHMTKGNYYLLESFSTSDGKYLFGCKDDRGKFNFYSKDKFNVVDFKETVDTEVKEATIYNVYEVAPTGEISLDGVRITGSEFLDSFFKPVNKFNQQEDVNMSTQRKVVEVQLFDDAKGLPVQDSLVAKFDNVLTEDDNDTTIREVIMNNDIKKVLAAHNVKRSKVINQDILDRTGNSVTLQPILLKDLRWKVIG